MRGSTTDKISYWLFADRIPLTKILIVSNIATFIVILLFSVVALVNYFGFDTELVTMMPWTLVTYPFIGLCCSPINLFFSALWVWWAGGSLERSWGTRTFSIYFFTMSAISALGLLLGSMLTGVNTQITGLWLLPLAGITISFAMLNPEMQILFMFIIPLKLKYLALLDVVIVLVTFGRGNPLLGVFALSGCAYAYWYVRPGRYAVSERKPRGEVVRIFGTRGLWHKLNPFGWIRNYRDRKRLQRLFESTDWKDNDGDKL